MDSDLPPNPLVAPRSSLGRPDR